MDKIISVRKAARACVETFRVFYTQSVKLSLLSAIFDGGYNYYYSTGGAYKPGT